VRSPLLALVALAGCAEEFGMKAADRALSEADGSPASATETRVSLRVDIVPSQLRESDATDAPFRVLPQTIEAQDLLVEDVELAPITLSEPQQQIGTVTAYAINPAIASLPGETVPVDGTVWIRDPDSIQAYAATTDALGGFEAWVVPDGEYLLEVVPADPLLPIFATPLTIGERPLPLDLDLGTGVPIYGFVRSSVGPLPGARVHVVSPDGATSSTAVADENGLYQVRVTPGAWTVVCDGRGIDQDPVLTLPEIVVGDAGANVDVEYPTDLDVVLVEGRVVNDSGESVAGTVVRFVAASLDGYDGLDASWVTERPVGADSTFLGYVVPGTYTVEVLPPTVDDGSEDYSPIRLSPQAIAADAQLDVLTFEPLRSVEGTVRGEGGRRLAGAQVTCSEIGFDERFWTVFSDDRGDFVVDLPRVPVACQIVPPGSEPGFATLWREFDPTPQARLDVTLIAGQAVRGSVQTEDGPEAFAVIEILDLDQRRIGFGFTDDRGDFEIRVDLDQARVSVTAP
jgi:hypothetical protein